MVVVSSPLDLEEWNDVLERMLRYHFNISEEIKLLVLTIRKEMKPELVPVAEEKANYGKVVKQAIRSMWALEYEIDDIQLDFAKSIGKIDISNLTDDFVEDVMLQSKPLQAILFQIRCRQKSVMEEIKKTYTEHIKDLERMKVTRPPKPEPKPAEPEKKEEEKKPEEKPAEEKPAEEPAPAVEAAPPAEVSASA